MNKGILKDAVLLFFITLVAGFALGLVHEITLKPIAAAQLLRLRLPIRRFMQMPQNSGSMILLRQL